ncbi:MAG: hypothetical protein U0414_02430 [Polyangiaceae bacterium]
MVRSARSGANSVARSGARFAVLVALAALSAGPRWAVAQPTKGPTPAEAEYSQHMKNGIQLYELKHFGPAIIEFEAAYKAKPAPGPLVNEALCYREQMKYPQAVAALRRALRDHGGELDPINKAAAEKAIEEMSPLIAYVSLKLDPPDSAVTIDDEVVPPSAYGEVELAPNEHTIVITHPGYESTTERFTVVSGEHKEFTAALVTRMGLLEIFAARDDVEIEVDGSVVGRGHWSGPAEQGNHAVRFAGDPDPISVTAVAKQSVVLDRRAAPAPKPPPPADPKPPPPKPAPEPMGFYVFVQGGLLYPTALPDAFIRPPGTPDPTFVEATNNAGAMGGLRAGFRINTYAAFEGSFDYSNVTGGRTSPSGSQSDPAEYSFSSWRLGPFLRLMSPGRIARFVGAVGGGLAFHDVSFSNVTGDAACIKSAQPLIERCLDSWGVDFFVTADAGVEFNIGRAILGLRLEVTVDGTKGSNDNQGSEKSADRVGNAFDNDPVPFIGPIAHFGYSVW